MPDRHSSAIVLGASMSGLLTARAVSRHFDKVIVVAYCQLPAEQARNYHPTVVVLGEGNAIERVV